MQHSLNVLLAVLEELEEHWRSQAILAGPDNARNPQAIAQANGVTLPDDFIHLYDCSNGMRLNAELYQDFDKNCFYFLSAEELRTEQRDLVIDSMRGIQAITTNVTVFVDYMHWSWQYGYF